ncbi:MAG: ComF family protein [Lachnospiraceae bacterium]|nr:ComF family protein [Lachnospiraceae bacterium]
MKETFFSAARRILYPARCPGCDGLLPGHISGQTFCDTCISQIRPVSGKVCLRCGKPVVSVKRDLCRDCEDADRTIIQGRSAFIYTGPMKTAMYRLKYSGRRVYAATLARQAYELRGDWLRQIGADVIVPIPMYDKKKRQRGYNQAEEFAKALSELMSVPVEADFLKRIKNTVPQKGLDRQNRQKNLKNAFKIRKSSVKFKCVLLVDDIYTTGTTIDEAARVLAEGIGCRVYSFCICVGAD